ncbi:alpha/beta fold hydrolase [Flavobacterium rakeshii]|uniref:Alpha/beta fold hydrolase n=1 Tax=Flavobacterium rakeshii TaxID=1038845 RepID=A0A6N8HFF5_9FLAO|nr:alpha/beta hydrolase [Flavobacterium rakeshii]MEE1900165.1 alpha/beta hydrolase [Flavobacterium rakeshii]MUV04449.1 alpha/beta fold hydrolase [Flavobacterium rakeshii]
MSVSSSNRRSMAIPKPIRVTAKVLEATSQKMAAKFAMKLFITPMKFPIPKREEKMEAESRQEFVKVPAINKTIRAYHYGDSDKKVLLVHGWSGRGTQLQSIAEKLVKKGYSTISFDAPGHGKAPGKTSDMTEFIAAILELEKQYGPFTYAVGHSLGGMSVLNAIKQGLKVDKAVIIGSGDIIEDIMNNFIKELGMNIGTGKLMMKLFEKKFGETINSYSAYIAAQAVTVPVLVIHDEDDTDVPVTAAHHIHKHLANSQLMITQGLGHRKILGDSTVIKTLTQFLLS